ncbi:Fe-S cluster assembly ATPase SufC [Candidatus Collierbacteria bacterium]|nr:Fe-S cluster assembly ATPase SufC [Candidatus Collierbacteria bacterium]
MFKIDNIHVSVDNKEVVKGVALEIRPGEIHALMGPNGSGKSSLAMALMGHPAYILHTPYSILQMDGKDITDKTPDERARMGLFLASQYPVGVEGVTVEQLLRRSVQEILKGPALPRQGRALSDTRIDVLKFRKDLEKLAKKVGVKPELLRRSINVGFSGGEKKRLEVLQMLVLKPKYAILDETDSGLDVDALKKVAEMVKTAKWPNGYKPGILVITHYTRLLKHLQPDNVHIIKDGRIVETGGKQLAERIEKEGYK